MKPLVNYPYSITYEELSSGQLRVFCTYAPNKSMAEQQAIELVSFEAMKRIVEIRKEEFFDWG